MRDVGRIGPGDRRPPNRPGSDRQRRPSWLHRGGTADRGAQASLVKLQRARQALSDLVAAAAKETAAEVGFGWEGVVDAPDTYDRLRPAYRWSETLSKPLPVSSLFCYDTIYVSPTVNMAFRFWHDVHHVRFGLTFDLVDELELALWHLAEVTRRGHRPGSLVWRLLQADLVGQIQVMALVHRFPLHQREFVEGCIRLGIDAGVLAECRLPYAVATTEAP